MPGIRRRTAASPNTPSKIRAAMAAQTTQRNHLLVLARDTQTARPRVRTITGRAASRCTSDNPPLLATDSLVVDSGSLLVTDAPVTTSIRVQTATTTA